ncbi:MAG: hypothetical protein HOP31_12895 [Ignavibacteria bacterium]|nr:hypothetical protein [Ignavibacteria bacterium]
MAKKKTKASFSKGHKSKGGRPPGSLNKSTIVTNALKEISEAYKKQIDVKDLHNLVLQNIITEGLLAKTSQKKLVTSFKLLPYIVPEVKTDENKNKIPVTEIHEPGYTDIPKFQNADNNIPASPKSK